MYSTELEKFTSESMPELIYPDNPEFFLDVPKYNRELLTKLSRKKSKIFLDIKIEYEKGKFQELIETGLGRDGYIYFALNEEILYLVRYKRENISLIGREAVTQFLIWANKNFVAGTGLAANVFFNHLLEKHKTIVSDYTQTEAGKRFWQHRIKEAFDKNLFVYLINSQHRKVTRLKSMIDLGNNTQHWRDDKIGRLYRFAISSEALEERI